MTNGRRGPDPSTANARGNLGTVNIVKGQTKGGLPVVMWDICPICDPDTCPIQEVCPYTQTGKCTVRMKYLGHVYETLHGQVTTDDPMALFTIGFHMVPLYNQLVQFKMHEYGANVVCHTNNGKSYINPIFKEIRETIKAISSAMKEINPSLDRDLLRDKITHGDDGYYESLFEDGPEIQTRKRNKI